MNIKQANVMNVFHCPFWDSYKIFIQVLGTVDFLYGPENQNNELKPVNFGVNSSRVLLSRCVLQVFQLVDDIINISGLNESREHLRLSIYV